MTRQTLDYLLRLAIEDRDKKALALLGSDEYSPTWDAWGEAAAAVKELLEMKGRIK